MNPKDLLKKCLSRLDSRQDECIKVGLLALNNGTVEETTDLEQKHEMVLTSIGFFHFFELLQKAGDNTYYVCDDWETISEIPHFAFNERILFYFCGKYGVDSENLSFKKSEDSRHNPQHGAIQALIYHHYLPLICSTFAKMPDKIELLESIFSWEEDNEFYDEDDTDSSPTVIKTEYDEAGFYDFLMTYNIH